MELKLKAAINCDNGYKKYLEIGKLCTNKNSRMLIIVKIGWRVHEGSLNYRIFTYV